MPGGTTRWAVDQWLKSVFIASTSLSNKLGGQRFYSQFVPEGKPLPAVLTSMISGRDVNCMGVTRVMTIYTYQIKVITEGGSLQFGEEAYGILDGLIQNQRGIVADPPTDILGCYRTLPVSYSVVLDGGAQENHTGGLYAIYAATHT